MAGNSRLIGGPEDGTELDVHWPFSPEIRRGFDGEVLVYAQAGEADGVMTWSYVGVDAGTGVVEPEAPPEV